MKPLSMKVLLAGAVCALGLVSTVQADTYEFTVTCAGGAAVIEWGFGDSDPGKYTVREWTDSDYPECIVRDYREMDTSLQRIRFTQEETEQRGLEEIMKAFFASFE